MVAYNLYPIEDSGLELELTVHSYPSPVVSESLPLLYCHWREPGQGTWSLWQLTLCARNPYNNTVFMQIKCIDLLAQQNSCSRTFYNVALCRV